MPDAAYGSGATAAILRARRASLRPAKLNDWSLRSLMEPRNFPLDKDTEMFLKWRSVQRALKTVLRDPTYKCGRYGDLRTRTVRPSAGSVVSRTSAPSFAELPGMGTGTGAGIPDALLAGTSNDPLLDRLSNTIPLQQAVKRLSRRKGGSVAAGGSGSSGAGSGAGGAGGPSISGAGAGAGAEAGGARERPTGALRRRAARKVPRSKWRATGAAPPAPRAPAPAHAPPDTDESPTRPCTASGSSMRRAYSAISTALSDTRGGSVPNSPRLPLAPLPSPLPLQKLSHQLQERQEGQGQESSVGAQGPEEQGRSGRRQLQPISYTPRSAPPFTSKTLPLQRLSPAGEEMRLLLEEGPPKIPSEPLAEAGSTGKSQTRPPLRRGKASAAGLSKGGHPPRCASALAVPSQQRSSSAISPRETQSLTKPRTPLKASAGQKPGRNPSPGSQRNQAAATSAQNQTKGDGGPRRSGQGSRCDASSTGGASGRASGSRPGPTQAQGRDLEGVLSKWAVDTFTEHLAQPFVGEDDIPGLARKAAGPRPGPGSQLVSRALLLESLGALRRARRERQADAVRREHASLVRGIRTWAEKSLREFNRLGSRPSAVPPPPPQPATRRAQRSALSVFA